MLPHLQNCDVIKLMESMPYPGHQHLFPNYSFPIFYQHGAHVLGQKLTAFRCLRLRSSTQMLKPREHMPRSREYRCFHRKHKSNRERSNIGCLYKLSNLCWYNRARCASPLLAISSVWRLQFSTERKRSTKRHYASEVGTTAFTATMRYSTYIRHI